MAELLDDLLDQLDHAWSAGKPIILEELFLQVGCLGMESACELCMADLEWRWRAQPGKTAAVTPKNSNEQLFRGLPLRPQAKDYQGLLIEWWGFDDCRQMMVESEWLARSAWGDQPQADEFLTGSVCPTISRDLLIQKLDLITTLELKVDRAGMSTLQQIAPISFNIGRQKRRESPPVHWNAEARRLVAWSHDSLEFSRDQLAIRRTRVDEIEVTNLSKIHSLHIERIVLKPLESVCVSLPFKCGLKDATITVCRHEV